MAADMNRRHLTAALGALAGLIVGFLLMGTFFVLVGRSKSASR